MRSLVGRAVVGAVLALAIAAPTAAQSVNVVFPGYRVYVAATDSTVSTHQTYHVALESAVNFALANGVPMRIELVGPVRVTATSVGGAVDTVVVTLPPDTIAIPCECDSIPPVIPPDTIPPVIPPDTIPPPSGALVQRWDLPDGSLHTDWGDPSLVGGGAAGGLGESRARTLTSPGPWGGFKVLENWYDVIPATAQPQVGTIWNLPSGISEMWLETWVRYDSSWDIGPDNPLYPGNVDHKLLFAWVRIPGQPYYPQRWECKVGPWWTTMPCSAATHDIAYDYMADLDGSGQRLDANIYAWDNQWHRIRWHAKMGSGDGEFTVWWDGMRTISFVGLDTQSAGGEFAAIQFGANRNQGTDQPMFFQFGPATIYLSDPGW